MDELRNITIEKIWSEVEPIYVIGVEVFITAAILPEFKLMVSRAMATWQDPPAALRKLSDRLMEQEDIMTKTYPEDYIRASSASPFEPFDSSEPSDFFNLSVLSNLSNLSDDTEDIVGVSEVTYLTKVITQCSLLHGVSATQLHVDSDKVMFCYYAGLSAEATIGMFGRYITNLTDKMQQIKTLRESRYRKGDKEDE